MKKLNEINDLTLLGGVALFSLSHNHPTVAAFEPKGHGLSFRFGGDQPCPQVQRFSFNTTGHPQGMRFLPNPARSNPDRSN